MEHRFYKYMGLKYLTDVFTKCQLKLSSRCEFNDKFDCFGHGTGYLSPAAFMPEKEYETLYNSGIAGRERLLLQSLSASKGINSDSLMDYQARILCLTVNDELHERDAPYFWGCYADNGKGARIGLRFDVLKTVDYEIKPVEYSDVVPHVDFTTVMRPYDDHLMEFYRQRVWTKGLSWRHEREQRLLVMTKDHGDGVVESDIPLSNGLRLMFLKFKPEMVDTLTFGPDASDKDIENIVKTVSALPAFHHLRYFRAERRDDKYVFDYESIEV